LTSPVTKLIKKRLEKYVSTIPKLLVSDDPENIHQTRVSSRRLQQVVSMLFPKPRTDNARDVLRSLRKVRRDLSPCRNLDVILKILQEKIETTGAVVDAWQNVRQHAFDLRDKDFARARKRLRRVDLGDFSEKAQRLLKSSEKAITADFVPFVNHSLVKWQDYCRRAAIDPSRDSLHALRLAGKQLRYRLEVMAEFECADTYSCVKSLKALQDTLGQWHDRYVLIRFVEDYTGKPGNRHGNEESHAALKNALEAEKQDNQGTIASILRQAESLRATIAQHGLQT
jgi:CHAD domain-containing protein